MHWPGLEQVNKLIEKMADIKQREMGERSIRRGRMEKKKKERRRSGKRRKAGDRTIPIGKGG